MSREVVYGRNPVRELIAAGARPVHEVWALASLRGEPWLAGVPVVEHTRAELGRLAGSSDHQGVVALTEPYPYADPRDLLERPGRHRRASTAPTTRATSARSRASPRRRAPRAWRCRAAGAPG